MSAGHSLTAVCSHYLMNSLSAHIPTLRHDVVGMYGPSGRYRSPPSLPGQVVELFRGIPFLCGFTSSALLRLPHHEHLAKLLPTRPLTCRQATAGTHGAAWLRAGLGDGGNADGATEYCPAFLRPWVLKHKREA